MMDYVYFAQRGHGFVKVGGTSWVPTRLASLKSACRPQPVRLIGAIDAHAAGIRERDAHRALAPHRFAGEWYWPRPEVFAFMDDLLARHGLADILATARLRLPRLTRGADLLAPVLA